MKRVLVATLVCASLTLLGAQAPSPIQGPEARFATDTLPSPAGPGSAEPHLAVGANGRLYMTWLEPAPDSAFALRFAAYDGTGWSSPTTIRSGRDFFVNWADFPSIIPLDAGKLAVHWLQRTGGATYAYGVRIALSSDSGRSWSAPIRPHRDSSNTEHGFVSLWRDGTALGAVWLDGRKFAKEGHSPANEMTVVTTAIDATGKLGAEATVDGRACDCCQTAAAMTSAGPIVAYRDRSADEVRDIAVVRRVKGKWTAPMRVNDDNWTIAACPVNGPAIDARAGRVAIAWFTAAGDSARVRLAFSSNAGAKFAPPIRIDDGNPAGRVDVALLEDGGALVTWIERTGGDTAAVRLRRVHRTGKAGGALTIAASSAARASGFPRMALTGDHVVFAWTEPGRPSRVRVARMSLAEIR